MTEDEVRAAAERLVQFHERFAPLFGKEQAQDHAYTYVKGLMVCPERKSIEPIALNVGDGQVSGAAEVHQHRPLGPRRRPGRDSRPSSPTNWSPPRRAARSGSSGWSTRAASPRRAIHSAGVARQHNGRLGKEDNCQVGVFLVGVTPGGSALLDHQLYLPEAWCEDTEAAATAAPRSTSPRRSPSGPSPQIAAGLIRQTSPSGHRRPGLDHGRRGVRQNGEFLDELEQLEQRYVVEVPVNTTVWTEDPASCVPPYCGRGQPPSGRPGRRSLGGRGRRGLPAEAWQRLQVREGAKGPLAFEFATVGA